MNFQGKVVLITGAASGIGKQFSQSFLERRSKVCLCDINVENLKVAVEELTKTFGEENVTFCYCDVSKDEDLEAAFDKCEKILGTMDILINNAGMINEKKWKKTININLGGVISGSELALKRIGKHNGGKGGHIINIASTYGITPCRIAPFYGAADGGIVQYSTSAGNEFHYNYTGVTIQCLCPGLVATPFRAGWSDNHYTPQTRELVETAPPTVPLTPEEVSDALFKLLSEKKTGAVLVVEKGKEPFYAASSGCN